MKKICSKILMILLIGFCLLVNVKANTDYFEEIDIEILNEIIEMENSLVVFVGNDNDQEYQAYLEAYHILYDKQDETIQSHFVKLNKDNLQNDSIEQLLSYAYKQGLIPKNPCEFVEEPSKKIFTNTKITLITKIIYTFNSYYVFICI